MAKGRKTVDVEFLKTFINSSLQHTADGDVGYRQGLIVVMDTVLHKTGNYQGYGYLTEEDMELTNHEIPGIRLKKGTRDKWENTDKTRVKYF
jgi:hypothetical protein